MKATRNLKKNNIKKNMKSSKNRLPVSKRIPKELKKTNRKTRGAVKYENIFHKLWKTIEQTTNILYKANLEMKNINK